MEMSLSKWNTRLSDKERFNNPYAQAVFAQFINQTLALRLTEKEYRELRKKSQKGIFEGLLTINDETYIGKGHSIYCELREIANYCRTLLDELEKVGKDLKLEDVALYYQKIYLAKPIRCIADVINVYIISAVQYNIEKLLQFEIDANQLFNPENKLYTRLEKDLLDILEESISKIELHPTQFNFMSNKGMKKLKDILKISDLYSSKTLQITVDFFIKAMKQMSWNHQNLDYEQVGIYLRQLDQVADKYYLKENLKQPSNRLETVSQAYMRRSIQNVEEWMIQYEKNKKVDLTQIPFYEIISNIPYGNIELILERELRGLNDITHRNRILNDYLKRYLMLETYQLVNLETLHTEERNEIFTEVAKDIAASYIFKAPLIQLDQQVMDKYKQDICSKKLVINHLMAFMDLEFVMMYVVRIIQHINSHVERVMQ